MQIFKTTWLNSYIGIWLVFQGAITLPFMSQERTSTSHSAADASADNSLTNASLASVEPGRSTSASEGNRLLQPWRLPQAAGPGVSVRVAQKPALEPLDYGIGFDRSCLNWETSASSSAMPFQVLVNEQVVAEFPDQAQAYRIGKQLKASIQAIAASPKDLKIARDGSAVVVQWRQQQVFTVDSGLSQQIGQSSEAIAATWINALRATLEHAPLSATEVEVALKDLAPTEKQFAGVASWYGPYFHGRRTASGETFNQNELTAAHPSLPFDTKLKVTNRINGRSVIVRINDRGPYIGRRSLDLSRRAAQCIKSEIKGVVPYQATILQPS